MTYTVVAYETTTLTYQIEADDPKAALAKYNASTDPSKDFGEPEEELLGVDDVRVDGHPEVDGEVQIAGVCAHTGRRSMHNGVEYCKECGADTVEG